MDSFGNDEIAVAPEMLKGDADPAGRLLLLEKIRRMTMSMVGQGKILGALDPGLE